MARLNANLRELELQRLTRCRERLEGLSEHNRIMQRLRTPVRRPLSTAEVRAGRARALQARDGETSL